MCILNEKVILMLGHHVCLFFTQYAPYHLKNGTWDEESKENFFKIYLILFFVLKKISQILMDVKYSFWIFM